MAKFSSILLGAAIFLVLIFGLFFATKVFITGYLAAPGGGYGGGYGDKSDGSGDGKGPKCGEGNCLAGESCYKDKVCCPPGTHGANKHGVFYCAKNCGPGEYQCADVCCKLKNKKTGEPGQRCKDQLGIHGVCVDDKENCPKGTSPCPPEATGGKIGDCCNMATQICDFFPDKKGNPLIWFCNHLPNKCNTPPKTEACRGKILNKPVIICCKPGECRQQTIGPAKGAPYCKTTSANALTSIAFPEDFDIESLLACDGCTVDNGCLEVGSRTILDNTRQYCESTSSLAPQKAGGEECTQNYECLTNQCNNGQCASPAEIFNKAPFVTKMKIRFQCFSTSFSSEAKQNCLLSRLEQQGIIAS